MYAIGLVASFCINMGSLIIYRYFMGTKEVIVFDQPPGDLPFFIVLTSCFGFLAWDKPYGTALWGISTCIILASGIAVAKKRWPEKAEVEQAENEMDMILYLAESPSHNLQIFFSRPRVGLKVPPERNEAHVSFFSPRQGIPAKAGTNHFRFPIGNAGLYQRMVAFLKVVEYELADRSVTIHFGWPMSSWSDRLAIGVLVFNLMRLPRLFPSFDFSIRYKAPFSSKAR
jgi:hypothetical protein